eukprot:5389805-Ditylum_brightwellii.AAC.1
MAEFDHQAKLSAELREKYANMGDDAELMGLYEEGCDPNPEVKKRELNRCLQEEDLLGLYSVVAPRLEPTIENSNSASKMHSSQHPKTETRSTLQAGFSPKYLDVASVLTS